jgi:hypothetical protein
VMVSQAVGEGIWRFVLERNNRQASDDRPTVTPQLVKAGILTDASGAALTRIWGSFRNDVHHMHPKSRRSLSRRSRSKTSRISRSSSARCLR